MERLGSFLDRLKSDFTAIKSLYRGMSSCKTFFHRILLDKASKNQALKLEFSLKSIGKIEFFPFRLFSHKIASECDYGVNLGSLWLQKSPKNRILEASWTVWGVSWGVLEPSWGVLERTWAVLARLEGFLDTSWGHLKLFG